MSTLRSQNPAFGAFGQYNEGSMTQTRTNTMTIGGTVTATTILLSIVAAVGVFTFQQIASGGSLVKYLMPLLIGSFIAGIVVSFVIYAKPKLAMYVAPVHAVLEGVFVGALSYFIPMQFLGSSADPSTGSNSMQMLILQAVVATFAITAGMLTGYATGILRLSGFVKKLMFTMLMGLVLYVVALFVLQMFGVGIWNGYADTGLLGIGFTGFCVVLASLFLLWDFEYIERGVQAGAPKYMEWVGAWGLMVTLVWLYIEILRLLSKLQSRD